MSRNLLRGLVVLMVAICCPGSLIALIAGGSVINAFAGNFQEPENVEMMVYLPQAVNSGEVFFVELQIKNQDENIQILDNVDINSELINAITIAKSDPPFMGSTDFVGFYSYYYEWEILPGDVLDIRLEAVADHIGNHPVFIDICINTPNSCSTFQDSISIE